MIFDAIKHLNLPEAAKILKIGDTVVDVQEGKNANVNTAMVLTGTQTVANLKNIKPDYIFESIKDLRKVLSF